MIQEAINSNDPVIFLEPKSRYWQKGPVEKDRAPLRIDQARIVRSGSDVTVIGHGAMVGVMQEAADVAKEEGINLELLDLRSLSPIDYETILESVHKTGRAIVAQEAPGQVSVGSEVAATLAERAFYVMEAPVLRVSGFNAPFPPAQLESLYLPDLDRILDAVDKSMAY